MIGGHVGDGERVGAGRQLDRVGGRAGSLLAAMTASRSVPPFVAPVTPSVSTPGVNVVGVMRSSNASKSGRTVRPASEFFRIPRCHVGGQRASN